MAATRKLYAGVKLREIRARLGLTQAEYAAKLGVSLSYLNQMENNHRPVSARVVLALAGDVRRRRHRARRRHAPSGWSPTCARPSPTRCSAQPRRSATCSSSPRTPRTSPARCLDAAPRPPRDPGAPRPAQRGARPRRGRARRRSPGRRSATSSTTATTTSTRSTAPPSASRAALAARATAAPPSADWLDARHGIALAVDARRAAAPLRPGRPPPDRLGRRAGRRPRPSRSCTRSRSSSTTSCSRRRSTSPASAPTPRAPSARPASPTISPARRCCPTPASSSARRPCATTSRRWRSAFDASIEQVAQRLSTLQRPGARGVPFWFVRVDQAGTITKRHSAARLQFARFGGACPLWNVHQAFETPGRFLRQLAETPDGVRYLCLARDVSKPGGSFRAPVQRFAIGLGCEIAHAPRPRLRRRPRPPERRRLPADRHLLPHLRAPRLPPARRPAARAPAHRRSERARPAALRASAERAACAVVSAARRDHNRPHRIRRTACP